MATVNGQEISNRYGGGIVFANNFTVNTNTPLDVRLTKTTKEELLNPTSWVKNSSGQYLVYTGMLVVVTSDTTASNNGIWEYVGPDDVENANPTDERNWVHLISGEISNTTINAAIDAKINKLDVDGYAQAEMSGDGTTLTIKGIQEVDGKIGIPNSDNLNLNITIDGGYNKDTNKIATQSTVTTAINALDVETPIQAVTTAPAGNTDNTVLTFKGIKEENGKIVEGNGTGTFIVGDAKLKIQIGSSTATDVFSANAQADSTIKLDGLVFKKNGDVISVITESPLTESNKLVTKDDINNLVGAMHYRGGVTSVPTADNNTKKGDVWIVTTAFDGYEVGDMFIARADGASATFDTVQGNLTLGIRTGQIAKNDGDLVNNKLVIATLTGIKTIDFDGTNLTSTENDNNTRTLSYTNGDLDSNGLLYHSATITDTFKVIGKDFTRTINISSANRSIEIARNAGDNDSTGVVVDLVWNTSIE